MKNWNLKRKGFGLDSNECFIFQWYFNGNDIIICFLMVFF